MKAFDWLVNYFSEKNDLSKFPNLKDVNFFEAGFIDSFGIIELTMKIENDFKIKFSNDAFQDRRFSTIGGLAEIIEEQK